MKINNIKKHKLTLTEFVKALFNKNTPKYIKLIVGTALVYTLFPADVLPDIFGPIGFLDDAAAVSLLTTIAMKLLNNYQQQLELQPNYIQS